MNHLPHGDGLGDHSRQPAQGITPPRALAGRVRYLQPGELKAVVEACPEWLRPIVALAA